MCLMPACMPACMHGFDLSSGFVGTGASISPRYQSLPMPPYLEGLGDKIARGVSLRVLYLLPNEHIFMPGNPCVSHSYIDGRTYVYQRT